VHCPACHKENPPGATHCEFCRTPLPEPSSQFQPTVPISGVSVGDARFEPGSLIAGRYLVERELGRGGMGVVYLVKDQQLRGKEVAIKLISMELTLSPQAKDRFVQEVLAAQELQHPNIIRVFHLDEVGGQSFFTMEYVPGRSLRDIVEERKREGRTFTLKESEAVLMPVLKALNHAHTQTPPVIHRDIKPDNIVVTGDLSAPQVKVLDFGLAKMLSPSQLTTTAMTMGTAYYMAPEQVQGAKDIDQRADLFSVGVVMYETLTGRIPSGRFKLPTELNGELPAAVDDIVDTALQQEPADRYASAREMGSALESAVRSADEEAKRKEREAAEAEMRRQREAEEAVKRQAEAEARRIAQEEARCKAEEEARLKVEAEARCLEDEGARRKAADEAWRRQLEAERLEDEEFARRKAETESRRRKMFFAAVGVVLTIFVFLLWKGFYNPSNLPKSAAPQVTVPPVPPQVTTDIHATSPAPNKYALKIRTEPADARVEFVNSSMTYRSGMEIAPGTYEIEISKDGYSPKRQQVRVTDRNAVSDVRLTPLYALTIRPTPSDAQVKILNIKPRYQDGIKVEPGQYKIEVAKSGYIKHFEIIDVLNEDVVKVIELEKDVETQFNSEENASREIDVDTVLKEIKDNNYSSDKYKDSYLLQNYYASQVVRAVRHNWRFPRLSNIELIVIIELCIASDGKIENFKIIRGSGRDDFDFSVKKAIENTEKLPLLPNGLSNIILVKFSNIGSDYSSETYTSENSSDIFSKDSQELYQSALELFYAMKYKQAEATWAEFVKGYPKDLLVPNAVFWQGECFFMLHDYANAVLTYQKVIEDHSKSNKYRPALLKQGISLYKLKKGQAGKLVLDDLIEKFPDSPEAQRAQSYLK